METNISFQLVNESKGNPLVTKERNTYTLNYPCSSTHDCTEYEAILPKGTYYIELYGASGSSADPSSSYRYDTDNTHLDPTIVEFYGGNAENNKYSSNAGSGGYTAGLLTLTKETHVFIAIGGTGESSNIYSYNYCGNINVTFIENPDTRTRGGFNG